MPERHHLRANPFRENRHDHAMVGRTEEFKKVASVVEEAIENKMPAIVPIIAPYGMGKTFTLLQLRQEMKGRFEFFEKTRKVVTAYASATQERFPSKYSSYIYTSCIDDIGESGFAYLRNELSKAGRPPEETLGKLKERDFKAAFIALGEEQSRSTAWGWLRGENIPQKKLASIGITSKISGDGEADRCLSDFLRTLSCIGYDAFVLLLDELEQAYSQGKVFARILIWARRWYEKAARMLSEAPDDSVPVIMFLSCAPETWDRIRDEAETGKIKGTRGDLRAFLDRIPPENVITLAALRPQETKDLVREFLSKAHAPGFKPPDPSYPFEENSINKIFEISQGVPRFAIRTSRILLRDADEEGRPINLDNLDRWLRKAKITE